MIIKWKHGVFENSEGLIDYSEPSLGLLSVWAKGYFFDGDRMFVDDEIASWLVQALRGKRFEDIVPEMNGTFVVGVVSSKKGSLQFATSRYGGMNVYLVCNEGELIIGDQFWQVVELSRRFNYNPQAVSSMLVYGCVLGDNTLIDGVQVLSNAAIYTQELNGDQVQFRKSFYFEGGYKPEDSDPVQLRKKAGELLHNIFRRYAAAYDERNWKVHIPLSGGLDSRLVAALLVWGGAQVEAFSYGPTHNAESSAAQKTADALGIPVQLFSIDQPDLYTTELIDRMTYRIGMKSRFTAGVGAELFLSGYDPKAVYITGHPANLPVGDATRRGANFIRTKAQLQQHLSDNHKLPIFDDQLSRLLPTVWRQNNSAVNLIPDDLPFREKDPIGSLEWWEMKYHFHNLLSMEMSTYAQFGHFALPFCDYELFDFYNSVPFNLRFQRKLHVDAILNEIFVDGLSILQNVPMANGEPLRLPRYKLRDRILFNTPASFIGDRILESQSRSKQKGKKLGQAMPAAKKYGPDPFDWWWNHEPDFRKFIFDQIQNWGGLNGMVDVAYLKKMLTDEPQHAIFYRYGLAAILTLRSFETITSKYSQDQVK